MSYAAMDIEGMDLFTMPFRSMPAYMAVPVSDKPASRAQPMAPQTYSSVQQPKNQVTIEQNHDISEKTGAVQLTQEQNHLSKNNHLKKSQDHLQKSW